MTVVFHIDGGLGKHILGTAILKVLRREYPNSYITIVCSYPDVFKNNPKVDKVYKYGEQGNFYERYVKGNENNTKIFYSDPYHHSDYILEKEHLLKIWCKQWELEYKNERPELYISQAEYQYFAPFYKTDKPILVIQPNGGPQNQRFNYSWTRDIPEPVVNDVINYYKDTHSIIHIKREDQKVYENTFQALDGFRSIAILMKLASKRLLIDSFAQHISGAFNLKSTVCWIATKPEIFGYDNHDNIVANKFTLQPNFSNNLYQPFGLSQDITTCPYEKLEDIFNTEKIIKSLENDTTNLDL